MFILFDYQCTACNHQYEELVERRGEFVSCPKCGHSQCDALLVNHPYKVDYMVNPAKYTEMMAKGRNIRNKVIGKVPWRKSSESQSS